MISRNRLLLAFAAVPAVLALLLSGSLVPAVASPLDSTVMKLAVGTAGDTWTASALSTDESTETSSMVAAYNGAAAGSYVLYAPHVDMESTLFVQNTSDGEASPAVYFYDATGSLVHYETASIPAYSSLALELDSLDELPLEYEGSVIVEATQPIQAVVNIEPDATGILLSYTAVATADESVVLPEALRNYFGYNSTFWVQNAGSSTATVDVTYYGFAGIVHPAPSTIFSAGSRAYDLADVSELGDEWRGMVVITSDEPLAVAVETSNVADQTGFAWRGIPSSHSDLTILAPRQIKSGEVSSGAVVANMGTVVGNLEARWFSSDGTLCCTDSTNLLPTNVVAYNASNVAGLPESFDGSLVVDSTDVPLAGLVRWWDEALPGDGRAGTPAVSLSEVGTHAYLPRVAHSVSAEAFSELSIQNVEDDEVDVTLTFYNPSGAQSAVISDEIPPHGVVRYNTGDLAELGEEWEGSVVVSTTTGGRIAVEAMEARHVVASSDSDGDGIPYSEDLCPAEDATGYDADQDGCIDTSEGLLELIVNLPTDALADELVQSLVQKVNNVEKLSTRENICAAVNVLGAFQNEVEAQRGKKITDDTAILLIEYSSNLIDQLLESLPEGETC